MECSNAQEDILSQKKAEDIFDVVFNFYYKRLYELSRKYISQVFVVYEEISICMNTH